MLAIFNKISFLELKNHIWDPEYYLLTFAFSANDQFRYKHDQQKIPFVIYTLKYFFFLNTLHRSISR